MDPDNEILIPETASPTPTPSMCSTLSLNFNDAEFTEVKARRDDLSVVRSSLPELRTIKVNNYSRVPSISDAPPLTSVISTDMSVSALMDLILERCRMTGLDTSAYCLVARTTIKGQDIAETTVLEASSLPLAGDRDKLKRSRFSIRQRGGRLLEVYDGRKWPVVRCGSVYVTSSDSSHRVTQSVLCTPNVQEKKRKASKYTVAIGTSHGHVQAFLKESEAVLNVFEKCTAEEKCLLLIKKPKDPSKKMLKNQAATLLSASDTHLYRQFEGVALTAHTMKNKPNQGSQMQMEMTSQIYATEPRVRKGGPAPRSNEPRAGARMANFVPIPELGIFTPDQHVLQNGTYAQHCHSREVNNNNQNNSNSNNSTVGGGSSNHFSTSNQDNLYHDRHNNHHHYPRSNGFSSVEGQHNRGIPYDSKAYAKNQYHNNMPSDHLMINAAAHSSMNSSFESSNQSDVYSATSHRPGNKGQQPPQTQVYHSCMDISALPSVDRDFNSLKLNSGGLKAGHTKTMSEVNSGNKEAVNSISNKDHGFNSVGYKDHDFNTISSDQTYEHSYRTHRDRDNEEKRRRRREAPPPKVESPRKKLDPSSRSHSLGDLSSGLTFSLVGQKKPDSMLSVATCPGSGINSGTNHTNDNSSNLARYGSAEQNSIISTNVGKIPPTSSSVKGGLPSSPLVDPYGVDSSDEVDGDLTNQPSNTASSALQHIRDRLQKAVLNSGWKFGNNSQLSSSNKANNKRTPTSADQQAISSDQRVDTNSSKPFNSAKSSLAPDNPSLKGNVQTSSSHHGHYGEGHYLSDKRQSQYQLSNSQSQQHQQQHQQQQQQHQQHQQHQYSSSNHHRPVLAQEPPTSARYGRQYSAPENASLPPTSSPKRRDSVETTSSYQSALSDPSHFTASQASSLARAPPPYNNNSNVDQTKSDNAIAGRGYSSHLPTTREDSPVKPKRTLPQVSLTETSERIKRFSEIMKSRVSSASNSRNGYSADGHSSSSQCTPTRVSSVETTGSGRSISRKSSIEGASDGETAGCNKPTAVQKHVGDGSNVNSVLALDQGRGRYSYPSKEFHDQNHRWTDKDKSLINPGNPRTSEDLQRRNDLRSNPPPQSYYGNHYDNEANKHNIDSRGRGYSQSQGYNHCTGSQGHSLNPEDVPLPPGDRSSDSGQTSGTSNSYTGSHLDSGYATNNDGESDHYHNHNHQQHQNTATHNSTKLQHYQPLQSSESQNPNPNHQRLSYPPSLSYQPDLRPHYEDPKQQYPSHQIDPRNGQLRQEKKRPPPVSSRQRSNLISTRQFGSVQNVSTAQAHGNPKDTTPDAWQPLFPDSNAMPKVNASLQSPVQNSKPTTNRAAPPYTAREYSDADQQNEQILNNVQKALMPLSRLPAPSADVKRQLGENGGPFQYKTATRRSWDYSDSHNGFGALENGMSQKHRSETRYRSTDVVNHRDNISNPSQDPTLQPQSWGKPLRLNDSKFKTVNPNKEEIPLLHHNPHHHHPPHPHQQQHQQSHPPARYPSSEMPNHRTQPQQKDLQTSHTYVSNNINNHNSSNSNNYHNNTNAVNSISQSYPHSTQHQPQGQENTIRNNHSQPRQQPQTNPQAPESSQTSGNVKQRPVPISRSNRNVRGRTLPGGFRFNESDASGGFGQASAFNFEISLYHLTQRYELSPLCLDLPKHLTLKDMASLKESVVEVSLNESLGIPSSPQGNSAKIGSPGSAFTPVKNEPQISGPPTILKVKVLSFTSIWKEVEKHCMLGLLLEADILVEVNGWFCLGADVAYLQRIVENCQGAITLTVARPRESDEKRLKGQTPVERIRSLESEISRLDDLIHARDEKIKELSAASSSSSSSTSTTKTSAKQILSKVNGEVPCEGMVIGEDEYVV